MSSYTDWNTMQNKYTQLLVAVDLSHGETFSLKALNESPKQDGH